MENSDFHPVGKFGEYKNFAKSAILTLEKKNPGGPMAWNVQNTLLNDTQSSKVRLING